MFLILLFVFSYADPFKVSADESVANAQSAVKQTCSQPFNSGTHDFFPKMTKMSKEVRTRFCSFELTDIIQLQNAILDVLIDSEGEFKKLNALKNFKYKELVNKAASSVSRSEGVPNLNVRLFGQLGIYIGDEDFLVEDEKMCDEQVQKQWSGSNCAGYLNSFKYTFNFAQNTLAGPLAENVATYLDQLGVQWDDYFKKASSQTIWEMAINGYFFEKNNKEYQFLPPPDFQLIVLHPSVAVEYVPNASDGNKSKEAVLIELIGINWWKQEIWFLPSGGSAIVLYSDRAAIQDWGYGISLHFRNNLSLGYSYHHGTGGMFVSLDLWKAFQDKKTMVEKYRGKAVNK